MKVNVKPHTDEINHRSLIRYVGPKFRLSEELKVANNEVKGEILYNQPPMNFTLKYRSIKNNLTASISKFRLPLTIDVKSCLDDFFFRLCLS